MKILHLTLKKKWFDMIESGVKREEYREIKPYWIKRLRGLKYDAISFRNGYNPDSPTMLVKLIGISEGLGDIEWGAPLITTVFRLHLGGILERKNIK